MNDRADFALWCEEIGVDDSTLRPIAMDGSDIVDIAVGVEVRRSQIDGLGIFAMADHITGQTICFSRVFGRTKAGRYVNHSKNPNARFVGDMAVQTIVAIRDINRGDEVTINYRDDGVIDVGSIKTNEKG